MNAPATAREHNWTSLCFVISRPRETEGSMRGQDDASVLNMESILLLERWKAVDLEF